MNRFVRIVMRIIAIGKLINVAVSIFRIMSIQGRRTARLNCRPVGWPDQEASKSSCMFEKTIAKRQSRFRQISISLGQATDA